jgi:hypothetical protein
VVVPVVVVVPLLKYPRESSCYTIIE